MMENKKIPRYALAAGISLLVAAALSLPSLWRQFSALGGEKATAWAPLWLLLALVTLAGEILLGIALVQNKRDKSVLLGLSLMTGSALADLFLGFFTDRYMQHIPSYSRFSEDRFEFSFWRLLPYLAEAAALVCLLLFAYFLLNTQDESKQSQAKKLWSLPGILFVAQLPLGLLRAMLAYVHPIDPLTSLIRFALTSAAMFYAMLWFAFPEGKPESEYYGDGYKGMIPHLLLSIFTLGIYQLVWISKVTKYLNARVDSEPPMTPWHQVVASMFVPFYQIYWVYKSAQRLDVVARRQGAQSNLTVICTAFQLFSFFSVILPSILMQDKINTLALLSSGAVRTDAPCVQTGPAWGGTFAPVERPVVPPMFNPDQLPEL